MSSIIRRINRLFTEPRHYLYLFLKKTASFWPDKMFIKLMYYARNGKGLSLKHPKTFTEKQNWLKLYDRNPVYTIMADKYKVKEYVANIIGQEFVVPCLGKWNKPEDVDFKVLPKQFVLKCNHNSGGGMFICKDKESVSDWELIRHNLADGLKQDFYYYSRVWPYKNIERCIIADQFLDDHSGNELRDYKFWCFDGEPKVMYCTNKAESIYENFYDMDFKPLDISHGFTRLVPEFEKPAEFDLMKQLAASLSKGIPFVRVDFFDVEGRVYFGEFTFYDWGGMKPLSEYWENKLGEYINIEGV